MRSRSSLAITVLVATTAAEVAAPAFAWVYPEHRDITVLAVETLDPTRRVVFDRLWSEARTGHEGRLCVQAADATQGAMPACIDWAAMPAIAGDHSCSSMQLLDTVNNADWILPLADIAARLKSDLSRISSASTEGVGAGKLSVSDFRRRLETEAVRAQRINALRYADAHMQSADHEYAKRAQFNSSHFALPRPNTGFTLDDYLRLTMSAESDVNAVGAFWVYHRSALSKATWLARATFVPEERAALVRAMLSDEAFALHFLEDLFSAGHAVGTWGGVSQRKGTHDYYNEYGLEATTWRDGTRVVLMGDAHMRTEDAQRASAAVRMSLEQILDAAADRARGDPLPYAPKSPPYPGAFDTCSNGTVGEHLEGQQDRQQDTPGQWRLLIEIVQQTPVPGLGYGGGALPRFRAEVGPFLGVAGSLDARYLDGGFTGLENGSGLIGGADLSLRVGYGLEGVLGPGGDGLIYLSVGYRGDTASTNKFTTDTSAAAGGSLTAAVPARTGFSTRLRMPFYLVPGDLLILSPLYFIAPKTYEKMAVTAANGGLIPWQIGWATRFGRWQFVLGREVGVAFYGSDTLLAPGVTAGTGSRLIEFKSTYLDLPILEYRPYRAFDVSQTSELILQLYFGFDMPRGGNAVQPLGAPGVILHDVYSAGVRAVFDWRHYF